MTTAYDGSVRATSHLRRVEAARSSSGSQASAAEASTCCTTDQVPNAVIGECEMFLTYEASATGHHLHIISCIWAFPARPTPSGREVRLKTR
jgi:hypothetical protein